MNIETTIKLDRFVPRPYQRIVFDAIENKGIKRVVLCWARRMGKDLTCFNLMIRQALKKIGSYYYILPTYRQARLVLFDGMTMTGERFLDYIPEELIAKINIQEMKITFINGSQIYFLGSDNYDSLRGSNPCGIVFSEYAYQHPETYPTLRPILVANDGWAIFISTPFGNNHFYNLFEVAKNSPGWLADLKTAVEVGVVTEEQIETEKREGLISADKIQQEYFCSFSIGATGSYYSKYLNKMELSGQIGTISWEPSFSVYTAWDIGYRDQTVILFYQIIGRNINIIDCYSNDSVGLEHYVNVVSSKPYKYEKHFGPHDLFQHEFSSGLTRYDKARELGLKFQSKSNGTTKTSAIPNISVMDGIEAVRTTLPRTWIDAGKCKTLISSIRDYRREYDDKNKIYKANPLHSKESHWCDALRYLALSIPSCQKGSSPEELDKRYREAMYGNDLPAVFQQPRSW